MENFGTEIVWAQLRLMPLIEHAGDSQRKESEGVPSSFGSACAFNHNTEYFEITKLRNAKETEHYKQSSKRSSQPRYVRLVTC